MFGPPCKEKEILCRKLAFMFRGTWLTAEEIVEGELETPASSMSQEIRKLQDAGQPFPPRLMKGLLRAAFSRKEGPFFLYDLPSSLEEMHLFEREFGWAKVALEVVLPEWKGGLQTEALSKEYSDRGLLLQMLAKLSSDTLVHQVITQLQVCFSSSLWQWGGNQIAAGRLASAHFYLRVSTGCYLAIRHGLMEREALERSCYIACPPSYATGTLLPRAHRAARSATTASAGGRRGCAAAAVVSRCVHSPFSGKIRD